MSEKECDHDTTPGIFSWTELLTRDAEASKGFYTELLGWTSQAVPGPMGEYTMFMVGDRPVAGMVQPPADMGEVPTTWVSYITVVDLDATVAKAEALGAKICMPPTAIPGKGRFASLVDPLGAPISFWEFEKPE